MNCKLCDRPVHSKELCSTHYSRMWRTGHPEENRQGQRTVKPVEQRLRENSTVMPNGCWQWNLGINVYGYGKIKWEGRTRGAHTVAWYAAGGIVPEGFELDHVCHTLDRACIAGTGCLHRRCVNPEHLELVTKPENTRRRDIRRS